MNIANKLSKGHNKAITDEIVRYIGNDKRRFKELFDCFLSDEMRISQRASWSIGLLSSMHSELFENYHRQLIDALKAPQKHNAIRRNVVRTYQYASIPEEYEAELYDTCLNFVANPDEAIAVRAFSIRVCERVIEKYPEIANELVEVIKAGISLWSSGLKNRGGKFLKRWG